ncbi:hypothetical protein [Rhodoplanes azumiensis]|uniref:Sel1 repeat family protein n=1 Tax=Rhodoplanes azumiensis TaxID=1897628 RepID=A0ABW5ADX9_9BRAD
MSAPIDDDGSTVPLRYAPPWARRALERGEETLPEAGDTGPTVVPDSPDAEPFAAADDATHTSAMAVATPHREPEVILGVPFGDGAVPAPQAPVPQHRAILAASSGAGPSPVAESAVVAPSATDWPLLPRQPAHIAAGAEAALTEATRIAPTHAASTQGAPTFAAPPVAELVRAEEVPAATGRAAVVWLIPDTEPVRTAAPRAASAQAARTEPLLLADSPAMVPSAGDPGGFGWLKPRPFAGDVAVRELGRRLALDPNAVPEPPLPVRGRVPWRGAGFAAALAGVAAAAAVAIAVVLIPSAGREAAGPALAGAPSDRALMAGLERAAPVRLVLVELKRAPRGAAVPLGITLTRASADGALVLTGLAPGTRLTAGLPMGPDAWRLPLAALGGAALVPPEAFVGTMEIGVELRLADDAIGDRNAMRVEWTGAVFSGVGTGVVGAANGTLPLRGTRDAARPSETRSPVTVTAASPSAPVVDAEEIALLIDRGKAFLAGGDVAAARLLLRRAAEAGDAPAALLLGATFDPVALERLQILGAVGDAAQARQWYQRAAALGSPDAARKLDALAAR